MGKKGGEERTHPRVSYKTPLTKVGSNLSVGPQIKLNKIQNTFVDNSFPSMFVLMLVQV